MAARLAEAGEEAGWAVDLTYARGTRLGRNGMPGTVADSVAVRLGRGDSRAVATFLDGAFATGWTWTAAAPTIPCAVAYRPLLARVTVAVRIE